MNKRGAIGAAAAAIIVIVVAMAVWALNRPANRVVPPGRHLSQAEAVKWADEFCKEIGVSLSGPPVAVFPAPNPDPDQRDVYWGKRWHLKYPDGTEIDIADGSGIVTEYFSPRVTRRKSAPGSRSISQSDAQEIAERVRTASGQLAELGEAMIGGSPPGAVVVYTRPGGLGPLGPRRNEWMICWPRVSDGIEYPDQLAQVTIAGSNGAVLYYMLRFLSPAPTTANVRVTKEQAEKTARDCLSAHGIQGAALQSADRRVIRPNRKWEIGGGNDDKGEEPVGGPARHAWDCSFGVGSGRSGRSYDVFVDTETGAVIGGQMWHGRF